MLGLGFYIVPHEQSLHGMWDAYSVLGVGLSPGKYAAPKCLLFSHTRLRDIQSERDIGVGQFLYPSAT